MNIELVVTVFFAQLIFQFLRSLGTRYMSNEHVVMSLVLGFWIQVFWLITTAIGVVATVNYDWWTISAYMIGGLIGTYLNFKIKMPNLKDKS